MPLSNIVLEQIAKNNNFEDKELLLELTELFADRKEASEFLYLYGQYCEVMDDLVDEPCSRTSVDKAGLLRIDISNCPYYVQHRQDLYYMERLIHHQYFDMVEWEHSDEEWKRRDARALNHCSYNMLFIVILFEFGDETLRKFSLRFREHAHRRHLKDPI